MASFWARLTRAAAVSSRPGGPHGWASSVRARSRARAAVFGPQPAHPLAELLQAGHFVVVQRAQKALRQAFRRSKSSLYRLFGHLVGVAGHAGVGQQEVPDLVGPRGACRLTRRGASSCQAWPLLQGGGVEHLGGAPIRLLPANSW